MKLGMIILVVVLILVVILTIAIVAGYNGLVVLRNRVENQGAQVDVQLKRRADLIPNLIETTKGYANFEKSTLTQVTELRSKVMGTKNIAESNEASNALSREVSKILALGESYPELKANTNFLALQKELAETENKIVMSRQFYNDTVTKYNTAIMMFPKSILAGMFGFRKFDLLEATTEERAGVKITSDTFQF
ncbi:MAG: LemA family protein [Roseburia sp.]